MTNPDFNLADLLRTAREIDMLDDPIIRIDDPIDPQPGEDIPIESEPVWYPCDEIEEPAAEAPVEPEPVEEEYDPAVTCY